MTGVLAVSRASAKHAAKVSRQLTSPEAMADISGVLAFAVSTTTAPEVPRKITELRSWHMTVALESFRSKLVECAGPPVGAFAAPG
jgi:hypothetical protein